MKKNGIDESLNLLKELQLKLKNTQQKKVEQRPIRTEESSAEIATNKKPWGEKLVTAYEQQTDALVLENRKLKKYVNMLLKMNDYLKSQLVKSDFYQKPKKEHSFAYEEVDMMKMEMEYLKEINRQKQLEIQLQKKKQLRHEKTKSQPFHCLQDQIPSHNRHSSKCIPNCRNFAKKTLRKQSQTNSTMRKSSKKRKTSQCPCNCC